MSSSTQPAPEQGKVKPIPQGYHSLTTYLTSRKAEQLLEFVKRAFGAVELMRMAGESGMHAEVQMADSRLMMGGGAAMPGEPMPTALHLYVPDAEAVYERALAAGATSLHKPVDQPYGDHEAGVEDPYGNRWYIATHLGKTPVPEGMRALTPYLHPHGAPQLIEFLKQAFGAREAARYESPEGVVQHARIEIGDSVLEMGEAHGDIQPMPAMFYLYVEDCDAVYDRALQAGATSVRELADQPYGDRNGGVKDPFGNVWFIATHIKDVQFG